jgi:uncharacterized membrane protein YhaH (DUF805 family)
MEVSDLWRSEGTISRSDYLLWGSSLFGIKYGIDSFIAEVIFHRAWGLLNYFFPGQTLDFLLLSAPDRLFFATIMLVALPFIWLGVVLTMRRLRAVGLPVWLVYLFFVPFVNLLLFITLCTMPTIKMKPAITAEQPEEPPAITETEPAQPVQLPATTGDAPPVIPPLPAWPKPDRSLPATQQMLVISRHLKRSDFIRALAVTLPPSIGLAWLSVFVFQAYGWGTFVGLPFALGMMSAYINGEHEQRKFGDSVGVALVAITVLGFSMFFFAWEGMACLVMAAPIVYLLAFMGACLGHSMQMNRLRSIEQKVISIVLMFAMPLLMGAEYAAHTEASMIAVTSVVEIAAPPSVVWNHVVAFPELAPPDDWLFKIGIAYPIGATINGAGPGAVRKCRFSTGTFIEPIKVWDAPNLLQFGVTAQPPSMREFSWMHEIHPAHLVGYLDVHAGQFKLEPIADANGGMTHTRLVGTTWYQNKMWPAPYWRLWSDSIIHRIHLRVLKHIRTNAEKEMKTTA